MDFDDGRRLSALRDYRLLDTPPEAVFDNIVQLASRIFHTPIALVSLVDESRQWFKARVGLNVQETPRDIAFCDHAIRGQGPLVVTDATQDPRFAANQLVTGAPGVRFYCGVPVRTPEGEALGTLCLIDTQPRDISPRAIATLEGLAHQVEVEMEIRRRLMVLEDALSLQRGHQASRELLASMVVHDMRSPLTAVSLAASVVEPADAESRIDLDDIIENADRMRRMLDDVLDICMSHAGKMRLRPRRVAVDALARAAHKRRVRTAAQRGQSLELELPPEPLMATVDPDLVERVFSNLVGNALQHGPALQPITIALRALAGGGLRGEVRDRGTALSAAARASIFNALERGPHSNGHGLGLAFCKLVAEAHHGTIGVEPLASGGNCFYFELPGPSVAP